MTASLLDGKKVANERLQILKKTISQRMASGLRAPGLAVILLGEDPASTIYVNYKHKACKAAGIYTESYHLPAETDEKSLIKRIDSLNNNHQIDGILVQLPLPAHINSRAIVERILPSKDVDGFHPYNLGRLAQGEPTLRPCTPFGIIKLLEYYQLNPCGLHAVIIGKSNIVGRPMALELILAKATVTLCHRATKNLEHHVRAAELIIVAAGSKDIIPTDWFHENQIVLDVGMHRELNGQVRGDIDFHQVKNKVAWITPVPGGVGPMTISCLLENTLKAAEQVT
ncbi:MAG: bifunctional methylenetetrahydrofolate dehydrogenase/methenyltetrahydrofolate cyclohydrolase FolD [Legionellaceae bacterium]|nr:bifunctional methylenetetrahydrofolate dehydrogenase/methenyltetrahydrofolate cyclohydrolase FolD [Legionellaceae bacterium]